jgi:hypothetical protein
MMMRTTTTGRRVKEREGVRVRRAREKVKGMKRAKLGAGQSKPTPDNVSCTTTLRETLTTYLTPDTSTTSHS